MITLILFAAMMQTQLTGSGGVSSKPVIVGGSATGEPICMILEEESYKEIPCPPSTYGDPPNPRIDVPAIEEEYIASTSSENCHRPKGIAEEKCKGSNADIWACSVVECDRVEHKETHQTCADKSRVLLTDEGGGKHCVKFSFTLPLP